MLLCHVPVDAGGREEPLYATLSAHKIAGGCGCRWGGTGPLEGGIGVRRPVVREGGRWD